MLTFTESGREAIINCLSNMDDWGPYSEHFRLMLHRTLSSLNLRKDSILLVCGDHAIRTDHDKEEVTFSAEFYLHWLNDNGEKYMVGGLVWSESSQSFSIHT